MKIQVTQEHINKGERRSECDCPIALALKDSGFKHAYVADINYCVHADRRIYRDLPIRAQKFVKKFDSNLPVKPFTFLHKGVL